MEDLFDFRKHIQDVLATIDKSDLSYNAEEFWMIRAMYEFIEYHAEKNRLYNTAIALPLARGLHNGVYRKHPLVRNGVSYPLPYVIHCLTVCKMLADMRLPLTLEEQDTLLAAALCHDMIEDLPFPSHGLELMEKYHLSPMVYNTVKLVSKRKDFTLEEEINFFRGIQENKLALLIKLSDRGHNVTDLYNMSERKIRDYIGETRTYYLPMCEYARIHYPELTKVIEIQQDQMICLTKTVEMLVAQHKDRQATLEAELDTLRKENDELLAQYVRCHNTIS